MQNDEQDQEEFVLDNSWVEEQEWVLNTYKVLSKESMKQVSVYFIYLNINRYIDKVLKEVVDLHPLEGVKGSVIKKEKVLHLIQSKKMYTPTSKYKFQEMLQFVIPYEFDDIQSFAMKEDMDVSLKNDLLKPISIHQEYITFPESVHVFHETNSLFFIYKEFEKGSRNHTIKSILKGGGDDHDSFKRNNRMGNTKKVKMNMNLRTTRKLSEISDANDNV
jgi:hypothetical protein